MTEQISIALMGLGWVGTTRHATAIARSPDFKLVGVIDRNEERAKAIGEKLKVPYISHAENIPDVSWLNSATAITIATPPHSHFSLVSAALNRGLHVLTEKPFAMKVSEGESMLKTAKEKQRILAITHNFQFSQSALRLSKDIKEGKLGRIRRIHAVQLSNPRRRLPNWYETLPAGLFYDESPHLLYLLHCFSPGILNLEQASVIPSCDGSHTPALVQARYICNTGINSVPVTLDMHFESPLSEWHFFVHGEEAIGVIDIFRDIYLKLPNDGLHTTLTVLRSSFVATTQHWLQHFTSGFRHLRGTLDYGNNEIYRRFAYSIRSGEPLQAINPEAALQVLRMQHEILEKGVI